MPINKICDTCGFPFSAATNKISTCTSCLLRPTARRSMFTTASKSDENVLKSNKDGVVLPQAKKQVKK